MRILKQREREELRKKEIKKENRRKERKKELKEGRKIFTPNKQLEQYFLLHFFAFFSLLFTILGLEKEKKKRRERRKRVRN